MREKACFVLQAMEQHMAALGFGWADVTATQAYTDFDIHPLMADEFVRRSAIPAGSTRHSAARRCRASISKWMYAASRTNWSSDATSRREGSADHTSSASSVSAISPRI